MTPTHHVRPLLLAALLVACATTPAPSVAVDDPRLAGFMRAEAASGAWAGSGFPNGRTPPQKAEDAIESGSYLAVRRTPPSGFEGCWRGGPQAERVDLAFAIDPAGRPVDVEVTNSTDPCFDEAAASALRDWRYHPPRIDGAPARVTGVTTKIEFVIEP